MATEYDGIIIGAGPNGLTVAAYLAKAGLKILVLEKNFEAGGGLATEQVTLPGFLHNTHAVYMPMVDYAPPLRDLRVLDQGLRPRVRFSLPGHGHAVQRRLVPPVVSGRGEDVSINCAVFSEGRGNVSSDRGPISCAHR